MDDITLALLGDHDAAQRVTERGELLPCPFCQSAPDTRIKAKAECVEMVVVCFKCGVRKTENVEIFDAEFGKLNSGMKAAIAAWNTRAPALTPTQMAVLNRLEEMK